MSTPLARMFTRFALVGLCALCPRQTFGDGIGLRGVTRNGPGISVSFDAIQGYTYRLERIVDIADASWQFIPGVDDFTASNTAVVQMTDGDAFHMPRAFYRVRQITPCDAGLVSNSSVALFRWQSRFPLSCSTISRGRPTPSRRE